MCGGAQERDQLGLPAPSVPVPEKAIPWYFSAWPLPPLRTTCWLGSRLGFLGPAPGPPHSRPLLECHGPWAIPDGAGEPPKPPSRPSPVPWPALSTWGLTDGRSPRLWFSVLLCQSPHSGGAGTHLSSVEPHSCCDAWECRSSGPVCAAHERQEPQGSRGVWGLGRHAAVGSPKS